MGLAMFTIPRTLLAVLGVLFLVFVVHHQSQSISLIPSNRRPSSATPPSIPHSTTSSNDDTTPPVRPPVEANDCGDLAGLDDIVLVMKTGATEIYEKTPIHFHTVLSCGADYLIYSDLALDLGRTVVRDALAMMSNETREQAEQLEQYRVLRQHFATGGSVAELKGEKNWEIDKYKFLPMVRDAYEEWGTRKKWFVFVEADTYVSLHNLLQWLRLLDAETPIYTGAQIFIGDTEFAHGGSGFVMSTPAARILTETYARDVAGWEEQSHKECCGDKVVSDVLLAAKPDPVHILRSFPVIQGETPHSLDWSDLHWCRPAVSWHHVDAPQIDRLWRFEREWRAAHGADSPIRFADYYAAFVAPRLEAANWTLEGWDNLSNHWKLHDDDGEPETAKAAGSADACRQFCLSQPDCQQWVWSPKICRASHVVKLGWALANRPQLGSADNRVTKIDGDQAVSGWFPDRIKAKQMEFEPCRKDPWITKNV